MYTLHEQKQEQEKEKRVLSAPVFRITQDTVHTGGQPFLYRFSPQMKLKKNYLSALYIDMHTDV